MLEKMTALLISNDMCVLATCRDHKPHCSLMAYVTSEDGRTVYMATRRDTTKFRNLAENPQVSLLVDTRLLDADDRSKIRSITVEGWAAPVENATEEAWARRLLRERHPQIQGLLDHPASAIVAVHVRAFLLLEGPERATHMAVAPER